MCAGVCVCVSVNSCLAPQHFLTPASIAKVMIMCQAVPPCLLALCVSIGFNAFTHTRTCTVVDAEGWKRACARAEDAAARAVRGKEGAKEEGERRRREGGAHALATWAAARSAGKVCVRA